MTQNQIKIKVEASSDAEEPKEVDDSIVNNIKQEPAIEFELILPQTDVKLEESSEGEEDKVKKFQCHQCPKSFDKKQNLWNHNKVHKPKVKCKICGKEITNGSFKEHQKRHEGIKSFACDCCSSAFVMKLDLIRHKLTHRGDKKFKCLHCNRGFNNKAQLKNHLLTHSEDPRPFKCDLCPKNFSVKHSILMHMLGIHLSKTIFKCSECEFTTKWKRNLQAHKIRHSKTKKFPCPNCKKKFKSKFELQQHQVRHKTVKDVQCENCEKMFKSRHAMKRHVKYMHEK